MVSKGGNITFHHHYTRAARQSAKLKQAAQASKRHRDCFIVYLIAAYL